MIDPPYMEVSSQAYLVKRVYGLTFDVGVFQHQSRPYWTDWTPNFEDYFYHKRLLMKNSLAVVINSDMDFQVLADQVANQDHDFYGSQSENQIENSKAFSFQPLVN